MLHLSTVAQIGLIIGFWLAGEELVHLLDLPLPGAIVGLLIVLVLLARHSIALPSLRRGAKWAGSATAIIVGWSFAMVLGLHGVLRLSLLPRSISTPFAMEVSGDIGGDPDLTAVFVVLTGVFGVILGEFMLSWLPIRSALARGALFGIGAHGVGTAKAHQIGREEGSVAGLLMVFAGLSNVLLAPILAHWLR
jgi:putative effector of murein hydrolase